MIRDTGSDDPRVKVRPGRGSRPRTKIRPDYSQAPQARVIGVDRGRYRIVLPDGVETTSVKARELGPGAIIVGDKVRVTGDISGRKDTLARIVTVEERSSQLRRSTEEGNGRERSIVANADQLAIVTALAQPEPKTGMIDRCLVAAYDAGMEPFLILTKADLASPEALLAAYEPLGLRAFVTHFTTSEENTPDVDQETLSPLLQALIGHETVLVGHSGVGKSTLINALVPEASRSTGHVNEVTGKGRHTSTSAVSFALPLGGRIIDTPGVRSFGLAHVSPNDILRGFVDLSALTENCPRGCQHGIGEVECELGNVTDPAVVRRVASFHRLLAASHGISNYQ